MNLDFIHRKWLQSYVLIAIAAILIFQVVGAATHKDKQTTQPQTSPHNNAPQHRPGCKMSDSDGIIIVERLIRLIANMYIAYLNPLWTLLAILGTVISYGIHFAYESCTGNNSGEIYDLPWCMLSAWSLVMDWMIIAAYMVVQTTSHIGSELLGIIVGCVLVSMGIHSSVQAFPGENVTLRNIAIIVWLFIYFPWIYWPYVGLFEPYPYGSYRPLLPHQRLVMHFLNFFYNFWYSLGRGGVSGYGSYSYPGYYGGSSWSPGYGGYQQSNYYYPSSGTSWWSSLFGSYSPWSGASSNQNIYGTGQYCSSPSYGTSGYTASPHLSMGQTPCTYHLQNPCANNYAL